MKIFFTRLLAALTLAASLSACAAAATPAPKPPPIKLQLTLWPGNYPIAVAQQQGLYAQRGVEVQITYATDYPGTLTDYVTGGADGLGVSVGDLLPLLEKRPSTVVMLQDASEGADQLIATDDIKTVADLKGKRIGVDLGTYGEFWVRHFLQVNGIKPTDVELFGLPVAGVPGAFPNQVAAAHVYEPYTSPALANGGHVLLTSADTTPFIIPSTFVFPTDFVKKYPETVRAFVAATFEAAEWLRTHEAEAPAVIAPALNLSPAEIWFGGDRILTLAENIALFERGTDNRSIYFTTEQYVDFLTTSGRLTTKPNIETLFNPAFLK